jgi:hypothetical protein
MWALVRFSSSYTLPRARPLADPGCRTNSRPPDPLFWTGTDQYVGLDARGDCHVLRRIHGDSLRGRPFNYGRNLVVGYDRRRRILAGRNGCVSRLIGSSRARLDRLHDHLDDHGAHSILGSNIVTHPTVEHQSTTIGYY